MRSILLIAACLVCLPAFAQYQQQDQPTKFDKFITAASIEWAAYATDTFNFEPKHFNKLLTDRLSKKEIRATFTLTQGTAEADHYTWASKKQIDDRMLVQDVTILINDTEGEGAGGMSTMTQKIMYAPDFEANVYTDVTQILFIENGRLKSYIPWVSPKLIHIVTASGVDLGMAGYFSSCINEKYNYLPAAGSIITVLGSTKKMIRVDSVDGNNKLKELYGRNLLETLWPYIVKGNLKVRSSETTKMLTAAQLKDTLVFTARAAVPVYDSNGNETAQVVPSEALSPTIFTGMELIQDWFYDHTKNIVFNKITGAHLYAKKWVANEQDKEASPILKIIF